MLCPARMARIASCFHGGRNRRVAHALGEVDAAHAVAFRGHGADFRLHDAGASSLRARREGRLRGGDDGNRGGIEGLLRGSGVRHGEDPLRSILQAGGTFFGPGRRRVRFATPDRPRPGIQSSFPEAGSSCMSFPSFPASWNRCGVAATISRRAGEGGAAPGGRAGVGDRGLAAVLLRHRHGRHAARGLAAGGEHCSGDGALRCVRRRGPIESLQSFRCPQCGEPAGDVRHGRELEIESIEIEDPEEVKP